MQQEKNISSHLQIDPNQNAINHDTEKVRSKAGLLVAGAIGAFGLLISAMATPFVLPALRKHCLPYVPATDTQLRNLQFAFKKHAKVGDKFLDIGSGDGRICRLACEEKLFSQVDGVELNYLLILYSRLMNLRHGYQKKSSFYHQNLWRFPIKNYQSICIFGVETMMAPLGNYITSTNLVSQTIFACRFPFKDLKQLDEIGEGIDTVWVYKVDKNAD